MAEELGVRLEMAFELWVGGSVLDLLYRQMG